MIGDDWPDDEPADPADPAVHVYTRQQYERACTAAGLEPLDDARCVQGIGLVPLADGWDRDAWSRFIYGESSWYACLPD